MNRNFFQEDEHFPYADRENFHALIFFQLLLYSAGHIFEDSLRRSSVFPTWFIYSEHFSRRSRKNMPMLSKEVSTLKRIFSDNLNSLAGGLG